MGYHPVPKRQSYIPKEGSAKGRPLGISNLEDKIVEAAVKLTVEPIYEAVFEDSSYCSNGSTVNYRLPQANAIALALAAYRAIRLQG